MSAQTIVSLHGGANFSLLSNNLDDPLLNYTRTVQPTFGLSVSRQLTSPGETSLGVRINGAYAPRGADLQGGSNLRLKYLELAALADLRMPLFVESVALHLLAGPALGWLMSCKRELTCVDGEFNKLEAGMSVGGQLELGSPGGVGFTAGFQYYTGLTFADAADNPALKNRTISITGGLHFPIG